MLHDHVSNLSARARGISTSRAGSAFSTPVVDGVLQGLNEKGDDGWIDRHRHHRHQLGRRLLAKLSCYRTELITRVEHSV
jgi:hypothetical protein